MSISRTCLSCKIWNEKVIKLVKRILFPATSFIQPHKHNCLSNLIKKKKWERSPFTRIHLKSECLNTKQILTRRARQTYSDMRNLNTSQVMRIGDLFQFAQFKRFSNALIFRKLLINLYTTCTVSMQGCILYPCKDVLLHFVPSVFVSLPFFCTSLLQGILIYLNI